MTSSTDAIYLVWPHVAYFQPSPTSVSIARRGNPCSGMHNTRPNHLSRCRFTTSSTDLPSFPNTLRLTSLLLTGKLQTELKHTEQVVKRRVSLSNQDVTKQVYCCLLCGQTPLPEGQYSGQDWKVCHDCQNNLCPNCVVQIGKNVDTVSLTPFSVNTLSCDGWLLLL
ncbi:unnamed protein product [Schistosoma mattheei]|uniref:Uncharacterized protein n=1 Tax=Schistosoma mattheei TaxID=31246 RepID=A0A183PW05_9TREM|nr:unnamed protein product [Schistosoma mattheei]